MSFEELKQQNFFLPESMWGKLELSGSVSRVTTGAMALLALGSGVLIWRGNGSRLTWIGAVLFVVFLVSFALISHFAIDRQNRKIEELVMASEDADRNQGRDGA